MNQPGLSLFQGAGSLHLNSSAQRLEDEEELLDQQRRREEVQNRLDNEFGDLSDDNDDTNVSEYQPNPPSYPIGTQQQPHQPLPIAHKHFAPLAASTHPNAENIVPPPAYDERADLLAKFKADMDIEELKRRLALSESEKQRAFMARQQSHELLVESKGKISDQEDTIAKLKSKLKTIEHTNTDLVTQLECKQTLLNDALIKQQMIERNVGLTADRNADLAIKQANDRATAQATMHQQQLDSLRMQLDERQHELKTLQSRYTELQRSREAMLVEKSETINQLSKSIEEAQRHNRQLMAASHDDAGYEECSRLRSQVDQMCGQIVQLERSLQTANTELNTMTSLLHESTASGDAANRIIGTPTPRTVSQLSNSSTPILQDTTGRLRSELSRCLADQKERRAELQMLQQQLAERDADIKTLKMDENRLLVELETLNADAQRSATQLKHLSGDLQRVFRMHGYSDPVSSSSADKVLDAIQLAYERSLAEHTERGAELQRVLADRQKLEQQLTDYTSGRLDANAELSQELRRTQTEFETVSGKYAELLAAKEMLRKELDELREGDVRNEFAQQTVKLAEVERTLYESNEKCRRMNGELKEMRDSYEEKVQELNDRLHAERDNANMVAAMNKADIELKQLRNDCDNYRREIATLTSQLQQATETIADLRHNVALRHDNDQLLADLQAKAERFDQYIHQQQLQQHTPPAMPSTPNQPLRTPPERCASAPNHRPSAGDVDSPTARRTADETRMAAVLARKLKAVEDAANAEQSHLRQALQRLDMQLNYAHDTLKIRDGEVQLLKQAILSERSKVKQVMEERDAEVGELFEKQQCVLDKYRERLDFAQDTAQRLNERIAGLQAERRSLLEARDRLVLDTERLKAERDRHEGDREAWTQREEEWRRRVADVERSQATQAEDWERKYRAAKKSAASYKRYAEDKDAHIQRENERIRAEYKRTIEKIQGNVENIVLNK